MSKDNPQVADSSTRVRSLKKKLEDIRLEHSKTDRKRKFSETELPPKEAIHASPFSNAGADCAPPSFSSVLFVEIFGGTAGLTCQIRKLGCQGIAIDFDISKACKAPTIRLDLTTSHGQTLLLEVLRRKEVAGVHLAPPCGTSSRAREIKRRWGPSPRPLRSDLHPDGIPGLRGRDAKRVKSANILYCFTGRVVAECISRNIPVSVENPARSLFWSTSHFSKHIAPFDHLLYKTFFHHCMLGSRRKKHTLLLHTAPSLSRLGLLCDGKHPHEAWGYNKGWATAKETEYPLKLCQQYALAFSDHLISQGFVPLPVEVMNAQSDINDVKANQVAAGKQPRGKQIPPLVREFKEFLILTGPSDSLPVGKLAKDWTIPDNVSLIHGSSRTIVPKNSRVLSSKFVGKGGELQTHQEIRLGIHWGPDEFVQEALKKSHPRDVLQPLPMSMLRTLDKISRTPGHEIAKERTEVARKWMIRKLELRQEEIALKEGMSPHCAKVLESKNLLLFKEMMEESSYKDSDLFNNIVRGFRLMGDLPVTGIFPSKSTFATLTEEQVRDSAEINRKALIATAKRPMEEDIKKGVYEATMSEVKQGWLEGPFEARTLNPRAVLTRRFGVKQTSTSQDGSRVEKVRPIDDFTESLVNLTNGSQESIVVHGVDFIVASIKYRLSKAHSYCEGAGSRLLAKAIDLRKAYKQLPVSACSLEDSFLGVINPSSNKFEVYRCNVLPFGARAAVNGFCRTSHAMWHVGLILLSLHWTCYFDDFVIIESEELTKHTTFIANSFFAMLGWETSDEKGGVFASMARALGVVFDLSDFIHLKVHVCNSESRCKELSASIQGILDKGRFRRAEMETLRGRLIFAESQVFGRLAKKALREVSRVIHGGGSNLVDIKLRDALTFLKDRILTSPPRLVNCGRRDLIHIYTDACQDEDGAGVGGVAYDSVGNILGYFSSVVTSEQISLINSDDKQTVISELESLAVLAGLEIFGSPRVGHQAISFIDNEATLASMIKADSPVPFLARCSSSVAELEAKLDLDLWFERVASNSNPADLPSRDKTDHLVGVPRFDVDVGALLERFIDAR